MFARIAPTPLLLVLLLVSGHGSEHLFAAERKPLVIELDDSADWETPVENVQRVLKSAGETLWLHFPDRELAPIVVRPKGGPIVLFERGGKGEYQVRLDTGGTYWSQYSYQFAHEMGHILCNYRDAPHRNHWFEEAVCEMASLYSLRAMSQAWEKDPPYPNWRGYAPSLKSYADELIEKSPLPNGQSLPEWFADHEAKLYASGTNRELNRVVAVQLLPLFEKEPAHWEAVSWLNSDDRPKSQTFEQFLAGWQAATPERHRKFIGQIAAQFGFRLPAHGE